MVQSLIALGAGGIHGLGLGDSRQKFGLLPFPYTDSIFAIIGEELGLVGCNSSLALFLMLAYRGLRTAERCAGHLRRACWPLASAARWRCRPS